MRASSTSGPAGHAAHAHPHIQRRKVSRQGDEFKREDTVTASLKNKRCVAKNYLE
jgi:hypothetical protein